MSSIPTLVLAVTGVHAAQFGARGRKAFEGHDGSIGRSEDCDWVLSASGVSRVHAMIRCLNGIYFIEDRSTNGMLLNGVPLMKGEPSALKDGDRLQIDTFEVSVSVQAAGAAAPPAPVPSPQDVFATSLLPPVAAVPMGRDPLDDFLDLGLGPVSRPPVDAGLIPDPVAPAGGSLDPLSFLDEPFAPVPVPTPAAPSPGWNHTPGMSDHFHPPAPEGQRASQMLPENWDLTIGDFGAPAAAPAFAPAPAPAPAPVAPAPAAWAPPTTMPAAPAGSPMPADVQQMLAIVVDGVMDVLRARAEIKNTFRLPVTIIQRSENNPLKFAPNADEALQKILSPPNAAFLSGPSAFDDAFDDIRCHQMAMLAGVRAAFESLLAHFSPDRFEQEADGGKRSAFAGKGRYWEKYREHFEGLAKNPDECFRRLFGDEFARAYEEQLARLKSARRNAARR